MLEAVIKQQVPVPTRVHQYNVDMPSPKTVENHIFDRQQRTIRVKSNASIRVANDSQIGRETMTQTLTRGFADGTVKVTGRRLTTLSDSQQDSREREDTKEEEVISVKTSVVDNTSLLYDAIRSAGSQPKSNLGSACSNPITTLHSRNDAVQ